MNRRTLPHAALPSIFCLLTSTFVLFSGCDLLPDADFVPTGQNFTLDADIQLVTLTGSGRTSDYGPMAMEMTISSRTGDVETDELPACLTFTRRSTENQHMLLLRPQAITTTATGNSMTVIGTFCCNRNRFQPGTNDTYDLGPITDNAELRQIADIVEDKDISDGENMWMVQRAVYLVTDSTGLTQAYLDSLNALPADTVKLVARH